MDASKYRDEILRICKHYDEAEADLKILGRDSGSLAVAGVNQCRYAGQHLVRALRAVDGGNDREAASNLHASDSHVRRAIYDINDACLQFYLEEIDAFRKTYPVDWAGVVPDYGDIVRTVADTKQAIDSLTKTVEKREDAYDRIRPHAEALKKAYLRLAEYQPDAARALKERNDTVLETQRQAHRFWIRIGTMLAVAAVGAAISVVAIFV